MNVIVPETQVGFKFDGYFINWVREIDCLSSQSNGHGCHSKVHYDPLLLSWLDSSSIITEKTQSINDRWIRITLAYWSVDN